MENATDALKMAAAVLIFVGALSLAIMSFSKARQAATNMLDKEKAFTYYDLGDNYTKNREVSIDTVIANLYSYKNTRTTILFYTATDKELNNMEQLALYTTDAQENERKNSFLLLGGNATNKSVYGLDITDERVRNEPWTSTDTATKNFIDCLIQGKGYTYKSSRIGTGTNKQKTINFSYTSTLRGNSLIELPADSVIIERVGHYNYEDIHINEGQGGTDEVYSSTNLSNSTIVFSNNETIENEEGNEKKIIQYIFIK